MCREAPDSSDEPGTGLRVFTALAPQAMAAPMPWETSKTTTATTHHVPSTTAGDSGTVTVLCSASGYE
ncbi:hypothetical protein [Streptomyces flaveus]|uniref:hypothetical protein n=1 Tax=Streptomyces flaveus TaxID=66370 RepID=UPI00056CE6FC|nr:hypothetical protein [Streptomyces flaveus]